VVDYFIFNNVEPTMPHTVHVHVGIFSLLWGISMEYDLKYCLLERFHRIWFAILPSGMVPWSMVYNIALRNGSIEYGLQYYHLGWFHGVWFTILP